MRLDRIAFFYIVLSLFLLLSLTLGGTTRGENGILMVDRFKGGVDDEGLPTGWKPEKIAGPNSKYVIEKEKEDYFLRLLSVNDGFGLRKEISFDIRKYPYLSWWWKAMQIPKGGDIRQRETDDQSGQIFVIFPRFPSLINFRSMGYIWDTQAPKGLAGTSPAYSKAKYVVLQSGTEKLNHWVFETRNVYEDYKKYLREDPPLVGAVLIYINSQHTQTTAEICYTDIFFSTRPPQALRGP